ncbi:hypothetical protein GPA22_00110 [Aromatoleum toluvorans]|uniref:Transposase n=1 Tax=Aromatoleum toluvorans TaxID=92002 RepID=A0ABX1PTY1_9RHOO|nr:hypothetical protein [Aromatoleum toluvorans]
MATQAQTTLSGRRACGLVGISRTVLHYRLSDRADTAALWGRLIELAAERRRFGYRRRETLANGRRIKILTIVDHFTKKAIEFAVDQGLGRVLIAAWRRDYNVAS